MRILSLLGATLLLGACASSHETLDNHWHYANIVRRVQYQGFGYDPHRDTSYMNRLGRDMSGIYTTARNHLFWNPENPRLMTENPKYDRPEAPENPYAE